MRITFDICPHLHAMSDFGHTQLKDISARIHTQNAECYAQQDGKPCTRNGKCIIARDDRTWKAVSKKSWPEELQKKGT